MPSASRSLKYAQWVKSPQEKPERPGRTLATKNPEVIKTWAEKRKAQPSTIAGTEHGKHLGVLRFDFPGYSTSRRLEHVEWDRWLDTFKSRDLTFIFQEQKKDGAQSNFFQLDNPKREDG
jgi:hypothetical protein